MDYSTNTTPLAVTQPVALELIDATGTSTPIEAELYYDPRDPYAVTTVFMTGHSQVRWTFGRDLLTPRDSTSPLVTETCTCGPASTSTGTPS